MAVDRHRGFEKMWFQALWAVQASNSDWSVKFCDNPFGCCRITSILPNLMWWSTAILDFWKCIHFDNMFVIKVQLLRRFEIYGPIRKLVQKLSSIDHLAFLTGISLFRVVLTWDGVIRAREHEIGFLAMWSKRAFPCIKFRCFDP